MEALVLKMANLSIAASWLLVRRRVATAVPLSGNIRQSEQVDSPFVFGLLRPTIYLPFVTKKSYAPWEGKNGRAIPRHCCVSAQCRSEKPPAPLIRGNKCEEHPLRRSRLTLPMPMQELFSVFTSSLQ